MAYCSILEAIAGYRSLSDCVAGAVFFAPAHRDEHEAQLAQCFRIDVP
jgi:hypothetical protein